VQTGGQGTGDPAGQPWRDPAVAEADLHQVVERSLVLARGPDACVHDGRYLGQSCRGSGVPQVPG